MSSPIRHEREVPSREASSGRPRRDTEGWKSPSFDSSSGLFARGTRMSTHISRKERPPKNRQHRSRCSVRPRVARTASASLLRSCGLAEKATAVPPTRREAGAPHGCLTRHPAAQLDVSRLCRGCARKVTLAFLACAFPNEDRNSMVDFRDLQLSVPRRRPPRAGHVLAFCRHHFRHHHAQTII